LQLPSEFKIKAGFSSVKFGFSPLPAINYPLFYPLSAGSLWRLQAPSYSSFKVLDIPFVSFVFFFLFVCSPHSKGTAY